MFEIENWSNRYEFQCLVWSDKSFEVKKHPGNPLETFKIHTYQFTKAWLSNVYVYFIHRDFVSNLINIHSSNGMNSNADIDKLVVYLCGPEYMSEELEDNDLKKQLVNHMKTLTSSVQHFIQDQYVYQSLCEADRKELMERNSKLFAQYVLARLVVPRF